MVPVRVVVEMPDGVVEYFVHVNNRAQHALRGAVRSGWRRYPRAKAVSAQFTQHDCATCNRVHTVPTVRRVFNRQRRSA